MRYPVLTRTAAIFGLLIATILSSSAQTRTTFTLGTVPIPNVLMAENPGGRVNGGIISNISTTPGGRVSRYISNPVNNGAGRWQIRINNAGAWIDLAEGPGLRKVRSNDFIRFLPTPDGTGRAVSLTVYAVRSNNPLDETYPDEATARTTHPNLSDPQVLTVTPREVMIFHVTRTGTGIKDGSSWANAMTLQAALGIAGVAGDQIWIAEGIYTPHADDRTATFIIPASILVYGGFAGTEAADFDPANNPRTGGATILSGDLENNDIDRPAPPVAETPTSQEVAALATYEAMRNDNSNTVVTISGAGVTLDGLTIQNGESGTVFNTFSSGAGLFSRFATTVIACTFNANNATVGGAACFVGQATLTNCSFTDNGTDGNGGGAYFSQTATLTDCTFTSNTTTNEDGGGAYFSQTATLTDCTFTGNTTTNEDGGGAYFSQTATLRDCTFTDNTATNKDGGGAYFAGRTTLIDCTFTGNMATNEGGGGAYFFQIAILTDCTFTGNTATNEGGGGAYFSQIATLTDCIFTDNTVTNEDGGGAYFDGRTTLTGCAFAGNRAFSGGGAYFDDAQTTLTACTFTGNTAQQNGGGAYFFQTARLMNCVVAGNMAINDSGGGVFLRSGGTIINSTFYNNRTMLQNGGGVFITTHATSPFILQNNILIGNSAVMSGNQVYVSNTDAAHVVNIQHNLLAGGATGAGAGLVYQNIPSSNVTETVTLAESDAAVVFASTMAANANYLRLAAGSPAVNAGNNDYVNNATPSIMTDITGADRIRGGTVDLGAYESNTKGTQDITFMLTAVGVTGTDIALAGTASSGLPVSYTSSAPGVAAVVNNMDGTSTLRILTVGTAIITASQSGNADYEVAMNVTQTIMVRNPAIFRVTPGGDALANGSDWPNAMTLQAALGMAGVAGDQIWIAEGIYTPHADDQTATFRIPTGVLVFGGFAGMEAADFDPANNPRTGGATILSGDLVGNDIDRPASGADPTAYEAMRNDNSNTVVTISGAGVTLDGLTITAGEGGNPADLNRGAGLYAEAATLVDCTFTGNGADGSGGGAFFRGTATLIGCTFTSNTAQQNGGGAYFFRTARLMNCVVADNMAINDSGGGVFLRSGGTIINSTFYNNRTMHQNGGGVFITTHATSPFILQNNILIGNSAVMSGNQVYVSNTNVAHVVNIRHNLLATGAGLVYQNTPSPNVTETVTLAESDAATVFASTMAANANYLRLAAGSPAANAGNNDYVNNATPSIMTDITGADPHPGRDGRPGGL